MGKLLYTTVILLIITSPKAHAYIDPGTGSIMLQVIVGALAAGLFAFKGYFYKIRNFFLRGSKDKDDINETKEDSVDQ